MTIWPVDKPNSLKTRWGIGTAIWRKDFMSLDLILINISKNDSQLIVSSTRISIFKKENFDITWKWMWRLLPVSDNDKSTAHTGNLENLNFWGPVFNFQDLYLFFSKNAYLSCVFQWNFSTDVTWHVIFLSIEFSEQKNEPQKIDSKIHCRNLEIPVESIQKL
jgi:hypothetical protein